MRIPELCLSLICYGFANSFICPQLKCWNFFFLSSKKKAMLVLLSYPSPILDPETYRHNHT